MQPLLTVTVADHRAAHPDHAFAPGVTHVARAGHRRLAAAQQVGVTELPALVVPGQQSAVAYVTMLHENTLRSGLAPLDEARGLALLADTGLSQRKIAETAQVSQSHVSKRLSLLRLPEAAQVALAADEISIEDALALAALGPADRISVWDSYIDPHQNRWRQSLRHHVTGHHQRREVAKKIAANRAEAESAGYTVIESADALWNSAWRHRIHDEKDKKKAAAKGTLVVEPTAYGLAFYTTDAADGDTATSDANAKEAKRQERAATKARSQAARDYVRAHRTLDRTTKAMMEKAVVQVVLVDRLDYANSLRTAYKWVGDLVGDPPPAGTEAGSQDHYRWIKTLADKHDHDRLYVAWVMHIANRESRVRQPWSSRWNRRDLAYLDDLIEHGYELSAWEKKRYKASTAYLAKHGD